MTEQAASVERTWAAILRRGPYAMLAIGTLLAVLTAEFFGGTATLVPIGALALLAAGMHWWFADRRWTGRPLLDRLSVTYVVLRWVVAFVLTWLNPFLAVFAIVAYFDSSVYVRRGREWRLTVATAVIAAGSQSGGLPPRNSVQWAAFGALFVVNAGLALVFGRIAVQEADLADERTRTISDLEATNARLEAAMTENAVLQARLVAQAKAAGVHEERERLALEIHDTIAQNLTGIVTQLQAADEARDVVSVEAHRARAAALAREALGEARRSLQGLMPLRLDDAALADALGRLVADWSQSSGVPGELLVTGDAEPLHRDVESTVLRVAQESLTNVAKHARATRVGVTLSYMDDELTLDVRDDGVGFDPGVVGPPAEVGGVGLLGMRQRALRLAGELVVESEPGAGTAVSLRAPSVAHA